MTWSNIFALARTTAAKWNENNAPRLSASLAYYTLLSLAPMTVLLILICGLVFKQGTAEQQLLDQVRSLAGSEWVATVKSVIDNTQPTKGGVVASVLATIFLCMGASGVFMELRDSLNTIWDAPAVPFGVGRFIRRRIASVAAVLGLGVLILVSSLLGLALHLVETVFLGLLPVGTALAGQFANLALSFAATAALFALIFKFVPDVHIEWRDVRIGAALTALLFTIGHWLLGLYLTKTAVGSAYGAAGSLVALVAWVYYCAQIFFFGAVLTRVYATTVGSHAAQWPKVSPKTLASHPRP